jgi:hypothetical protein
LKFYNTFDDFHVLAEKLSQKRKGMNGDVLASILFQTNPKVSKSKMAAEKRKRFFATSLRFGLGSPSERERRGGDDGGQWWRSAYEGADGATTTELGLLEELSQADIKGRC